MKSFGSRLRVFRLQSKSAQTGKPLSQQELGELLQAEFGVRFSGAAVSDWERGKSKIHADDRLLLTSLIKLLREHGGIESLDEANELLEAGNYRALKLDEIQRVFPAVSAELQDSPPLTSSTGENAFASLGEKWADLLDKAREGPPPAWPRVVAALMRGFSDRLSAFGALRILIFLWLWLLTRALIMPSLRWPFAGQETMLLAVGLYCAGTMTLPALIGLLADTKKNKFWQKAQLSNSPALRLYTHQGAFIGFHLGYFAAFLAALIQNFLRLPSTAWWEWMLMLAPLIMGYTGARVVPYNLWRAFGRLSLRDGGVFFIFILLGPLWGFFLLQSFSLLTSPFGLLIALFALTLLAGGMAWRAWKKRLAR